MTTLYQPMTIMQDLALSTLCLLIPGCEWAGLLTLGALAI